MNVNNKYVNVILRNFNFLQVYVSTDGGGILYVYFVGGNS